jgi:putative flippase GtrA
MPQPPAATTRREPAAAVRVLLPRYVAVGVLSVAVDVTALAILHSAMGVDLLGATTVAFAVALVLNFTLNHRWAFGADGLVGRRMLRYAVIVAFNYAITVSVIAGLTSVGVFYLVAKAVSVGVTAIVNFTGYRLWVFR